MHIYGVWPWEVPKWPWFWAEVAVNAWRDMATLVPKYTARFLSVLIGVFVLASTGAVSFKNQKERLRDYD
jgi:hypothetical protein